MGEPHERLFRLYRNLSPEQQQAVLQLVEAMTKVQWKIDALEKLNTLDRWTTSELRAELSIRENEEEDHDVRERR
jgi:hypothetical protein